MTLNGVSLAVQMEVLADVVAGRMPWGMDPGGVGSKVIGSMDNWDIYKGVISPTDP